MGIEYDNFNRNEGAKITHFKVSFVKDLLTYEEDYDAEKMSTT